VVFIIGTVVLHRSKASCPSSFERQLPKDVRNPEEYNKCVQRKGTPGFVGNSIADFCVVVNPVNSEKSTSRTSGTPPAIILVDETEYAGPVFIKEAANDSNPENWQNHFKILYELGKRNAYSNQADGNLPFSTSNEKYKGNREQAYPKPGAHNPYYVEVTRIGIKGNILHGFLHFRIFLNRSEALGEGQNDRESALHGTAEKPDNAVGRISAALIMVKDQDGWPIGDFSVDIPCHRTCSQYPPETYYGDKTNALPCAYTPPSATSVCMKMKQGAEIKSQINSI
jgi:hypothetical protein